MFNLRIGVLVMVTSLAVTVGGADSDESAAARAALDREFDACFEWWGRVYDSESGGCFYSLSGKEAAAAGEAGFGPDIEATSKLVRVLEWTGLLEQSPDAFKRGIVRYMQVRQDPESGFFRDPQQRDHYTPHTLNRAVGMAAGSLRRCGGEPRYPLPLDRVKDNAEAAEHYAHLESAEALRDYLEKLPWETRTWTAGARVLSLAGTLNSISEPRRADLIDALRDVVSAKQRSNGFFGAGHDHWTSQLSGTYKTVSGFDKLGEDVPRAEQIAETVLDHLFNREYHNSIVLYNTANVLNILHRRGAAFSVDQRRAIVRRCTEILHTMRGPDGGFVTVRGRPSPEANGKRLGKPVIESNTNATGLMHKTRMLLIELLTGREGPHPHPRGQDLLNALPR